MDEDDKGDDKVEIDVTLFSGFSSCLHVSFASTSFVVVVKLRMSVWKTGMMKAAEPRQKERMPETSAASEVENRS